MAIRLHLDSLLLYDPNRSRATVNAWISRPSPSEEEALGRLFIIVSIDSPSRINHEIISIIQDELRSSYYGAGTAPFERAFEQALQRANVRLHQLIADGVNQWVDQIHIIVGAIKQQNMVLSSVRTMHAFLLRRSRLHDVLGQPDDSKPNPLRIFSQIIAGHVEPDDRLLFCTASLLDYFSLEKLRRTLLDHPPHEAVRTIENALVGVDPSISFSAFIMQAEVAPERSAALHSAEQVLPSPRTAPLVSMEELIARERQTEKLLAPSLWPAIRDMLQTAGAGATRLFRTVVLQKPPKRTVATAAAAMPEPARSPRLGQRPSTWRLTGLLLQRTAQSMQMLVQKTLQLRPRRSRPVSSETETVQTTRSRPSGFSASAWLSRLVWLFRNLDGSQKTLVAGFLAVLLILTTSLVISHARGNDSAVKSKPADLYASIEDQIGKAQAALLYGGEDIARVSLAAAVADTAKIPRRTADEKKKFDDIQTRLDAITQKISHLTVIENPIVVHDTAAADHAFQPRQLYVVKSVMYELDPATGKLVFGTPEPGSAWADGSITTDLGSPVTGAVTGTSIIFVTDRNTFAEFDLKKNTWKSLDATFPDDTGRIQSLSFFQNRLYALIPGQNDIMRLIKGPSSLGTASTWLKAPVTLAEARTAVVEGSIFVLQPAGKVEEYFSGQRGNFSLAAITPALTNATRLWTASQAKYLYLIDPSSRRLVVFNKKGALIDQYQSDTWQDLRDVVADESKHLAYILNGTSVHTIPLSH